MEYTKRRWSGQPLLTVTLCAAMLGAAGGTQSNGGQNRLLTIRAEETGGGVSVIMTMAEEPRFTVFRLDAPPSVIVDVVNASLESFDDSAIRPVGVVTSVSATQFSTDSGGVGRISIGVRGKVQFDATTKGKDILIRLLPDDPGAMEPAVKPAAVVEAPTKEAEPQQTGSEVAVEDVKFSLRQERAVVKIMLSGPAEYRLTRQSEREIVLEIPDVRLPDKLQQIMDASELNTSVRKVTVYGNGENSAYLVADIVPEARYSVNAEGNELHWVFEGTAAEKEHMKAAKEKKSLAEKPASNAPAPAAEVAGFATESAVYLDGAASKIRYTGKRISLDLKDADIHNVLRLIADVSRLNIITSDDVKGSVTIRLINVPWDQALDIILKTKGLDKDKVGNIIRVAPIEVFQKERELENAMKLMEEKTQPLAVRLIPVNYAHAKELEAQVKNMLSERGSLDIDERTNVIIVKDIGENLVKAEQLVRQLDTETPQILLEARIVETESSFKREIGVQWGTDLAFTPARGNPTGIMFPYAIGMAGGAPGIVNTPNPYPYTPYNYAVNLPASVTEGSGGAIGFMFASASGNETLALRLSALENDGKIKIISAPKVLTLDNKEAVISQGLDIPIATVSAMGTQVQLIPATLELKVVPHITAEGSVLMKLEIKKDEPDFARVVMQYPTILKKHATTELLLKDGDTTVIGGIYTKKGSEYLSKVPFFGDLPIIGWLFRKKQESDQKTELLIFITPRIVNRTHALIQTG